MGFRIYVDADKAKANIGRIMGPITRAMSYRDQKTKEAFAQEMVRVFGLTVQAAPISGPEQIPYPGRLRESGILYLDDVAVARGTPSGAIELIGTVTAARKAAIRFGNSIVYYAWFQHEQIYFEHRHGGQAKYVEAILLENKAAILEAIKRGGK